MITRPVTGNLLVINIGQKHVNQCCYCKATRVHFVPWVIAGQQCCGKAAKLERALHTKYVLTAPQYALIKSLPCLTEP